MADNYWTDLKFTKQAYVKQEERELFNALDIGLKTAAAAARAIAHAREQGRWSQIALLIENIREKTNTLKNSKDMGIVRLPTPSIEVN